MSGREIYDLSQKQMDIIKYRDTRRKLMREKYLNYQHNPFSQGELFDEAIKRWEATKLSGKKHLQIGRHHLMCFGFFFVFPLMGFYKLIKRQIDDREHLLRTGQIAYRDREFKFT